MNEQKIKNETGYTTPSIYAPAPIPSVCEFTGTYQHYFDYLEITGI